MPTHKNINAVFAENGVLVKNPSVKYSTNTIDIDANIKE
jgi:hypothetical protein